MIRRSADRCTLHTNLLDCQVMNLTRCALSNLLQNRLAQADSVEYRLQVLTIALELVDKTQL
jgi:hypothetical protein